MKKILVFVLLTFLCAGVCFGATIKSESNDKSDLENMGFSQIASFNVEILQFGFIHPGWGIGGEFESYLGNYFAVNGLVQYNGLFEKWFQMEEYTSTLSAGANFRIYPKRECLKGFYFGAGGGVDTMLHFTDNPVPYDFQKVFPYIQPEFGLKLYLFRHFMIDTHCYYKYQFINTNKPVPDYYTNYTDRGFNLGVSFKFFKGK